MQMNFLLTTKRLEKLAEDGLLDHADLHTCTEHINHKKALFNEWMSLRMLSRPKGDKWVEMPPGGYPFPPQFNEYIHLIADAHKQMLQARQGHPYGRPLYITSGDLHEPHSPTSFGNGNGNGNGHHTGPIFSTGFPLDTQPIAAAASVPTQMSAHMPVYAPVPAYTPGFAALPPYVPDYAAPSPYMSSADYSPLPTYMPQASVPVMSGPTPQLMPLPQLHPTPVPSPWLAAL